MFRRLETSVTRVMWSATQLTRLTVILHSIVMVLNIGDIRALTCAVGDNILMCLDASLQQLQQH